MPVTDDPKQHPRFNEWTDYCKTLTREGLPLPPFDIWLKETAQQTVASKQVPRPSTSKIRGENPPANMVAAYELEKEQHEERKSIAQEFYTFLVFPVCLLACFIIWKYPVIPDNIRWPGVAIGCILWWVAFKLRLKPEPIPPKVIQLNAYHTEFTSVVGDNSTVKTTIQFQMPSALLDYSNEVEQLNRITETLLLRYVASRKEPPLAQEIETYLEQELVQFQNERNIAIIRLSIAANVHLAVPKRRIDV